MTERFLLYRISGGQHFAAFGLQVLLGIAAVVFGIAVKNGGNTLLGSAAALVGAVAIVANTIVMMFGLGGFLPSPIAGGSGVLATLLLAICLFSINSKISQSDQT